LILVTYDSLDGKFGDDARLALRNMWALQLKTGERKGAFMWINFHNEPWEADESAYWGATLAALAVGTAPKEYRSTPEVRDNLNMLIEYLRQAEQGQSLVNRLALLWASSKVPELLDRAQQKAIIDEVFSKQQEDGGWSATSLIISTWKRYDGTPQETRSDGYGTGFVSVVLERAGVSRTDARLKRGLSWLEKNQDKTAGMWPATSLNKQRDPASDAGRFMSDAATAYSVMALTDGN
jgi:squalene-hopene/tetraprenyl-beta-curcumene cyclase